MSGMSYAATTLPASNKKTNQAYPRGQKLFKSRGSLTGNSGRISKEIGGRISISEKKKGGGERNKRWQNTHAHTHKEYGEKFLAQPAIPSPTIYDQITKRKSWSDFVSGTDRTLFFSISCIGESYSPTPAISKLKISQVFDDSYKKNYEIGGSFYNRWKCKVCKDVLYFQ